MNQIASQRLLLPKVLEFPSSALSAGRRFLVAWRHGRTRASSTPIALAGTGIKIVTAGYGWWVDLPDSVLATSSFAALASLASLYATRRRPKHLGFVWLPLYTTMWLASLTQIHATGGASSSTLFPFLVLYFVSGVLIQNIIPTWVIFAFTVANFIAWALIGPIVSGAAFVISSLVAIATGLAIFLPLKSESELANEVVKATEGWAKARVDLARATEVNTAKSAFLAMMSHEIRTPLTAVMGMTELVLSDRVSDSDREFFKSRIRENGNRLANLVNDILDFADIESKNFEVNKSKVDLHTLLGDVGETWRPKAESKGLVLTLKIADEAPDHIVTDPKIAKRILGNIIENALKFTKSGYIAIEAASAEAANKDGVNIFVSDTGCGIAPQDTADIFRPFVQADGSSTRTYGGAGLGLAVAHSLARLLGHEVKLARSSLGEGSTFSFCIAQ